MHAKRVCKDFEIEKLAECHDLHLNEWYITFNWCFWKRLKNVFLKIYELDPVNFFPLQD